MTDWAIDGVLAACRAEFSGGAVELLETHISWVVLAGELAFKLKKPVNFGFVDFSTLEKRRTACDDELRLNRRTAPDMYLDVVPLTGPADRPRFGGDGEVLDYAVRMRRFDQAQLLPAVLARGELRPEHLDQLARSLAAFHAEAATARASDPWGEPERVVEPARNNLRQLELPARNVEFQHRVAALSDWTEAEFRRCTPLFRERKAAGRIRECHGDLHLGNMLLADDRIVLFDCLEFSAKLRWIDVASEVAFLVMDLAERGRPDLAARFRNAYFEQTGDCSAIDLLPFYTVYRALVRAKVARLRSGQTTDRPALARAAAEYAAYLALAERETRPRRGGLLLTHGLSGSGKSTATQVLVDQLGALRLRSDVVRKRICGLPPAAQTNSGSRSGIYTPEISRKTFRVLRETVESWLAAGELVVVDATFLREEDRRPFLELAQRRNLPWGILELTADVSELRRRIAARQAAGTDASEATLAVLEDQLGQIEPLIAEERAHAWTVSPDQPLDVPAVAAKLGRG